MLSISRSNVPLHSQDASQQCNMHMTFRRPCVQGMLSRRCRPCVSGMSPRSQRRSMGVTGVAGGQGLHVSTGATGSAHRQSCAADVMDEQMGSASSEDVADAHGKTGSVTAVQFDGALPPKHIAGVHAMQTLVHTMICTAN